MPSFTTAERIHAVEVIINYEFHDKYLLVKALEAAGATMAGQGNKRLALIGDAALRLVLYEFGYEDEASIRETPQYILIYFVIPCPNVDENVNEMKGDMTNAQNTRATNENLAKIGFSLGIDAYIQLNPSAQGVVPERLMATTIEAIIGAVYLDRNKDIMVVRRLIIHLCVMPTL
ncbi:uncharacterized protein N7506_005386 [Penicillium brevicompactum]|uniref:uncharacterized protein n=1 Tax=Penicillium brevicompactum TaxID=5074 RepID=UPI002540A28C|nr:uncharacterized protein N7506_005386 [Penicillium brevicompactum]KAJ5337364.1 hypothetical protein N7506_005386 [Penicillium brevicompactum]